MQYPGSLHQGIGIAYRPFGPNDPDAASSMPADASINMYALPPRRFE